MRYQLRSYRVRHGEMDEWLREWRELVYPLRLEHGFLIVGAWVNRDEDRFVWMVGHEDFDRADSAYYASPQRTAMDPDPARHLVEVDTVALEPILGEGS
jgi:hypothetical protein